MRYGLGLRSALGIAVGLLLAGGPVSGQAADVATVVGVVDSTSFDVQATDAPVERVYLAGLSGDQPCIADAALARIHELVDGQAVSIETDTGLSGQDPAGRELVYVWLPDGSDLNEVLLGDGLARTQLDESAPAREAALATAQANALEKRVGVWASGTCPLAAAPPDVASFVPTTSGRVQEVLISAGVLHQQADLATRSNAVFSQAAWQQSTAYAIAELHAAALAIAKPASGQLTQPLAQRFAATANDIMAAADSYQHAVDAHDAQLLGSSDAQIQSGIVALQPLTQELAALGASYNLGD